jgi:hypothetical protein
LFTKIQMFAKTEEYTCVQMSTSLT